MIPDIGIALAKNFALDRSVSGNAFIVRLLSYVKGALLRFESRTEAPFINYNMQIISLLRVSNGTPSGISEYSG